MAAMRRWRGWGARGWPQLQRARRCLQSRRSLQLLLLMHEMVHAVDLSLSSAITTGLLTLDC